MLKYIRLGFMLFVLPVSVSAQHAIDSVLSQIEINNTTLSALRKSVEAEKIGNKTGIYLQNPEVGFNYLWGNPSAIGNRTDINIKQTFDFPTAYKYKNQISDIRNLQTDLEYQQQRKAILYSARILYTDYAFANILGKEYENRISRAQLIADSYKVKFEKGESGILEYNKTVLHLSTLSRELEVLRISQNTYQQQLEALNGGKAVVIYEEESPARLIPADFLQWYDVMVQSNPDLLWLKQEIESSRQQENLNRALSLPKASAGYMSEKIVGEHFQGMMVGISVPLWENKNKVKYAQAQTSALLGIETDQKLQFYNQLKAQYDKAASLQEVVLLYKNDLKTADNSVLLKKALDMGEISLIEYLMELSLTYTATDNLLRTENELNKTIDYLMQFEF